MNTTQDPTNTISDTLRQRISRIRLVAFDFDGVFTDNTVYTFDDGHEAVRCWRGDGIGLQSLKQRNIASVIISTEVNPVVSLRSQKLKIRCIQNVENKLEVLQTIAQEYAVPLENISFVGNDVNDLDCLKAVGFAVVVQDAHPDVTPAAHYRTRTPGGFGAVREVCDLLVNVQAAVNEKP